MNAKHLLLLLAVAALPLGCGSPAAVSARQESRLGVEAARRGYWQEAVFRFERARQLSPGDAQLLNNLAVAQEALGRYDDALASYKAALEHAPTNTAIRRNYARFAEFFSSYARGVRPKKEAGATP